MYTLFVLFIGHVSCSSLQTLCMAVKHGGGGGVFNAENSQKFMQT